MNIAKRLELFLGDCCYAAEYRIGDETYLVTTGTGEGCFAYHVDDVARFLVQCIESADYNDFCEAVSPVEDRDVALALAHDGVRIDRGGSCMPVLTDSEYSEAAP
jgi:hypothetical protein